MYNGSTRGEKGAKKYFQEIVTENIQNLLKNNNTQSQEAQQTSSKINSKISTIRYILLKIQRAKTKEKS